jgi:surfactin synthase thioesterase subunit
MTGRPWFLVREAAAPARVQLVCFPHAGAGPSVFRDWPHLLDQVTVMSACLPGRELRFGEAPLRRLAPSVDLLAGALRPMVDRELVLFGHSLGALLAYETAQWLMDAGGPVPSLLILSACPAPHRLPRERTFDLPHDEFLARIEGIGGLPQQLREAPELLERVVEVLRADLELMETYRHRPRAPLSCPIVGFYGTGDPRTSREDMVEWDRYSSAGYSLRAVPGGHFFINDGDLMPRRVASELASLLGRSLDRHH